MKVVARELKWNVRYSSFKLDNLAAPSDRGIRYLRRTGGVKDQEES